MRINDLAPGLIREETWLALREHYLSLVRRRCRGLPLVFGEFDHCAEIAKPTNQKIVMPDPSAYLIDDIKPIFIGEVAEITGATRKAIRHYEAIKLLPPPKRRGTYRTYTSQHVFMVHVIRHAQSYGFTLDELRELIGAINQRGGFPTDVGLEVVRLKRASVRRELEALHALDKRLGLLLTDIKKHFG